jgi:hypothetical protein
MYELQNFAFKTYSSEVERGQNTVLLLRYGLERPPGPLWPRNRGQKRGRSSPFRCFARVQFNRRDIRNLYTPKNFASPAE